MPATASAPGESRQVDGMAVRPTVGAPEHWLRLVRRHAPQLLRGAQSGAMLPSPEPSAETFPATDTGGPAAVSAPPSPIGVSPHSHAAHCGTDHSRPQVPRDEAEGAAGRMRGAAATAEAAGVRRAGIQAGVRPEWSAPRLPQRPDEEQRQVPAPDRRRTNPNLAQPGPAMNPESPVSGSEPRANAVPVASSDARQPGTVTRRPASTGAQRPWWKPPRRRSSPNATAPVSQSRAGPAPVPPQSPGAATATRVPEPQAPPRREPNRRATAPAPDLDFFRHALLPERTEPLAAPSTSSAAGVEEQPAGSTQGPQAATAPPRTFAGQPQPEYPSIAAGPGGIRLCPVPEGPISGGPPLAATGFWLAPAHRSAGAWPSLPESVTADSPISDESPDRWPSLPSPAGGGEHVIARVLSAERLRAERERHLDREQRGIPWSA